MKNATFQKRKIELFEIKYHNFETNSQKFESCFIKLLLLYMTTFNLMDKNVKEEKRKKKIKNTYINSGRNRKYLILTHTKHMIKSQNKNIRG